MPLVSALAASHAPNILLEPGSEWEDFMDLHYSMAPKGSSNRPTLEQQKKLRQDAEAAFAVLREDLERSHPDVLVVVANDQFVNFFWNNIPTFFVTVAEEVKGQFTRHRFQYRNHKELGNAIIRAGMEKGIDFSYGENIELQHTQNVPLYFLLREPSIPILPVYVNTWVDPAPSPRRCYQVGELIRAVAEQSKERIAILATGGLSHFPELSLPRVGETDIVFDRKLIHWMETGEHEPLQELTADELHKSGSHEFLNWMVLLGAVTPARADVRFFGELPRINMAAVEWRL